MVREIERKFKVADASWRNGVTATSLIRQGYLMVTGAMSLRVRIIDGSRARLCFKSGSIGAASRDEYEYDIPLADAAELMALAGERTLEKRRSLVVAGKTWEVDEFLGRHSGLVLAEIELSGEDEDFPRPGWLGEEVTGNPQFSNSELAAHRS